MRSRSRERAVLLTFQKEVATARVEVLSFRGIVTAFGVWGGVCDMLVLLRITRAF